MENITSYNFYNNGTSSKLNINIEDKNGKKRTMAANVLHYDLRDLMKGMDFTDKYFHLENGVFKYSNPKK